MLIYGIDLEIYAFSVSMDMVIDYIENLLLVLLEKSESDLSGPQLRFYYACEFHLI